VLPLLSTTTYLVSESPLVIPVILNLSVVVLPEPLNDILLTPEPFCICITASLSDPLPCLKVTPFNVELVKISGSAELLYACCKFVVGVPPAAPVESPNFDALKNIALEVSLKSVAELNTDKIPIKIALLLKFENSTYCSVAIPATA
jgi:hypothetical protein